MNRNEHHSAPGAPASRNVLIDDLQREVDAAAEYGLFPPIELESLADSPITILISPRLNENGQDLSSALEFIASKLIPRCDSTRNLLFRAVELTRLGQVTNFGCDVAPSTAPIYASESAKKALEYGNVVMVFDPARLDKTFAKVLKSECPATLRRLSKEYPSVKVIEEDWLWFSKLPPGDGRIGTGYEMDYSFFIPGNPHEALLMIFLIGNDRDMLRAEFLRYTSSSPIRAMLTEMDGEVAGSEQRHPQIRAIEQTVMQELPTGRTRLT